VLFTVVPREDRYKTTGRLAVMNSGCGAWSVAPGFLHFEEIRMFESPNEATSPF
jgi:hypothetical protein